MTGHNRGHACPMCGSRRLGHQRDERIRDGIARLWLCGECSSTCRSYDYVPGHGNAGSRQLVGRYAEQIATMATALAEVVRNGNGKTLEPEPPHPMKTAQRWFGVVPFWGRGGDGDAA